MAKSDAQLQYEYETGLTPDKLEEVRKKVDPRYKPKPKPKPKDEDDGMPSKRTGGAIKMACGGKAHMATGGMPKAKKGRRGDGICSRGRTKGRMV